MRDTLGSSNLPTPEPTSAPLWALFSPEHRWLLAGLGFALLFAWRAMAPALDQNAVQDDARHYVFWMERFHDPELFPNDLIADYLQLVAPPGYTAFYWALSWVADPMLVAKVLPPILWPRRRVLHVPRSSPSTP